MTKAQIISVLENLLNKLRKTNDVPSNAEVEIEGKLEECNAVYGIGAMHEDGRAEGSVYIFKKK